jgi:hypothetical protein
MDVHLGQLCIVSETFIRKTVATMSNRNIKGFISGPAA